MSKFGSFEWIVDYDTIKPYLDLNLPPNYCKNGKYVANIGCGTSLLSQHLQNDGYEYIDGLDNDLGCITFLRSNNESQSVKGRSCDSKLNWFHYDLVDQSGTDSNYFQQCGSNRYDIIIDKGTFDAILVEGSVSSMLIEVLRLLKVQDGIYVLCSINKLELLRNLFTLPMLGLCCTFYDITCPQPSRTSSSDSGVSDLLVSAGSIVVVRKTSPHIVDLETLTLQEERIMNEFFQLNHPLLTADNEQLIREKLKSLTSSSHCYSMKDVYEHVINDILRIHVDDYPFGLFLEDVQSYLLGKHQNHNETETSASDDILLSADDVIEFLRLKQ